MILAGRSANRARIGPLGFAARVTGAFILPGSGPPEKDLPTGFPSRQALDSPLPWPILGPCTPLSPASRRLEPGCGRPGLDPRNQTRGYRLIVQRDGKRVRLFTRNGHDWSNRFPQISEAALRNRNSSFVIDGEAVLLGVDGRSDFNGLHSRRHDAEVEFYAFEMLVSTPQP